jgi:hypothetical protein
MCPPDTTQNFQLALPGGLGLISPPDFAEQQRNKATKLSSFRQSRLPFCFFVPLLFQLP